VSVGVAVAVPRSMVGELVRVGVGVGMATIDVFVGAAKVAVAVLSEPPQAANAPIIVTTQAAPHRPSDCFIAHVLLELSRQVWTLPSCRSRSRSF
jgi:hypothetical protein